MGLLFRIKRKICWKLFPLFPKNKNKVVFQSFYGRGYSDSPKAIAEELRRRSGFHLYWVVKGKEEAHSLPGDIKPLRMDSVRSVWHLATAGFWVDCCRKLSYTEKSSGQYYIQTWHGFPLKRIEQDAESALSPDYVASARKDSALCDLFLSNSRFLTELYHRAFWYDGAVLECGFPRNDVLLREPESGFRRKICGRLHLPPEKKFCLYAPTFRQDMGVDSYDIDYPACVNSLRETFGGDWLILAKLHPNIAKKAAEMKLDSRYIVNVSDYPDIQELYLLSDAMISDYSSVMFDYMLTGKPCFLYVNDLGAYRDDRNFYFDIDKLPYPRAESNVELTACIRSFDAAGMKKRLAAFQEEFGIRETGNAAKQAADIIEEKRGKT